MLACGFTAQHVILNTKANLPVKDCQFRVDGRSCPSARRVSRWPAPTLRSRLRTACAHFNDGSLVPLLEAFLPPSPGLFLYFPQRRNIDPRPQNRLNRTTSFRVAPLLPAQQTLWKPGLSVILCSRHMMLRKRMYASQTKNLAGRTADHSRRVS